MQGDVEHKGQGPQDVRRGHLQTVHSQSHKLILAYHISFPTSATNTSLFVLTRIDVVVADTGFVFLESGSRSDNIWFGFSGKST